MRLLTAAFLALALLVAPADAAKSKPKLKVLGFSVNTVFVAKGTTVAPEESTNTCYRIGGPTGAPDSLRATAFVKAVKVPKGAVTHFEFDVPWNTAPGLAESDGVFDGPFKDGLFRSKPTNLGGAVGGPVSKTDFYTYRQLPTGLPTSGYLGGDYTLKVTAKVGGKTLSARGKITLQCA